MGSHDVARAIADLAVQAAPDHGSLLASRAQLALAEGEPLGDWPDTIAGLARLRPEAASVFCHRRYVSLGRNRSIRRFPGIDAKV